MGDDAAVEDFELFAGGLLQFLAQRLELFLGVNEMVLGIAVTVEGDTVAGEGAGVLLAPGEVVTEIDPLARQQARDMLHLRDDLHDAGKILAGELAV